VSSGSGSGSGADQHLLALLRAIRLRQAAPDAVAAGVADTAAALTQLDEIRRQAEAEAGAGNGPGAPGSGAMPGATPDRGAGSGPSAPVRPGWARGGPADQATGAEPPSPEPLDPDTLAALRAADALAEKLDAGEHADPRGADPRGVDSRGVDPQTVDPQTVDPRGGTPAAGESRGSGASTGEPGTGPARSAGRGEARPAKTGNFFDRGSRAPGVTSFFDHGPQLRPPGLPPIDPHDHGYPPEGDDADAARTHDEEVAARRAELPEIGEDIERSGHLSRNRFAGLTPVRPENIPEASAAGARDAGAKVPDHGIGRPPWATGEQASPTTPAPRLPDLDLPVHVMPPMVATPPRVIDGMDPSDDALLRETQRLLSTSLTFAGGPDEVADRLRDALLRAHPRLIAALPGDARTQTTMLAAALTWLVHHLDQPPALVSGCARLGAALAACGVRQDDLQLVGAALAEAMRAGMAPGEWRQEFDVAWRSTWQHVYDWMRHDETLPQPESWTATVVSHELRRPDLAVIRLRPFLPMPFRPGQYARVEVPGLPGIWRPYSLAGAPKRDDLLELHVRAKTTTGVSGTLVYRTREGDQVRLSRAEGEMALPSEPDRNLLMIAGDTGVAPLKALLTELADTGDERTAVLFWGVRTLDELYDIDDIAEIARSAKRATVVPVVSEGDPGPYASGLVTDAVAAYGEWSRHEVYLAGPPLMLAATSAALHLLGVAPDHIHHDAPE
jgi:NAD(P)H-flavin reductase/hemoglobin-like flavoprotein